MSNIGFVRPAMSSSIYDKDYDVEPEDLPQDLEEWEMSQSPAEPDLPYCPEPWRPGDMCTCEPETSEEPPSPPSDHAIQSPLNYFDWIDQEMFY